MSYCLNPSCTQPRNSSHASTCKACGTKLLLHDRYRIITILGQGGFGSSFLGRDISLPGQPSCLVKQLCPSSKEPRVLEMARKLFEREAETLGKIGSHPQIPRLLDYFEQEKQFYLVQEYIKGNNLHQEIKKNGLFTEKQVKEFLLEILPILKYLHDNGVIHRDIKPANIIRRELDKKLVLIDFGAVKDSVTNTTIVEEETALTAFAVGTPGFAPPEQVALRPIFASDIYALGITCLYLLIGKSPQNLDYDASTSELIWPDWVNVSKTFKQILNTMLEVSPRHRYKSTDEVVHVLEAHDHNKILAEGLSSQPTSSTKAKASKNQKTDNSIISSSKLTESMSASLIPQGKSINKKGKKPPRSKPLPIKLTAKDVVNYYLRGYKDFPEHNLNYLKFKNANLSQINFHKSQLIKVDFQGSNLAGANFGSADLSMAVLRDVDLQKAFLFMTNLEGADLRGANLKEAHLTFANLKGANLCGANLINAKVTKSQLAEAKTNLLTIMPNGERGSL